MYQICSSECVHLCPQLLNPCLDMIRVTRVMIPKSRGIQMISLQKLVGRSCNKPTMANQLAPLAHYPLSKHPTVWLPRLGNKRPHKIYK
jgi:hypothetical protein